MECKHLQNHLITFELTFPKTSWNHCPLSSLCFLASFVNRVFWLSEAIYSKSSQFSFKICSGSWQKRSFVPFL